MVRTEWQTVGGFFRLLGTELIMQCREYSLGQTNVRIVLKIIIPLASQFDGAVFVHDGGQHAIVIKLQNDGISGPVLVETICNVTTVGLSQNPIERPTVIGHERKREGCDEGAATVVIAAPRRAVRKMNVDALDTRRAESIKWSVRGQFRVNGICETAVLVTTPNQ